MIQRKQGKSGCGCLPLTLFAIVSVGAGFYFGKNLLGSKLTPQSSAKITPQSAFVTGYISTDISQWLELNKFTSPQARQILERDFAEFEREELNTADSNIDYEKDIAPWIGGISVALLPTPENTTDFPTIAIVGIRNKFHAWRFFSKQEKLMEEEIEKQKYKNITVYYLPEEKTWATFFGNYLVFSDRETGIKQVIDTYKGGTSLSELKTYKNKTKNPLFQVYLPKYDTFYQNYMGGFPLNSNQQSQLDKLGSMSMNMTVEDYGLNLKTIVNFNEGMDNQYSQNRKDSRNFLAQMPEDTMMVMTGGNIDRIWKDMKTERQNIPMIDYYFTQTEQLFSNWLNLDLEKDLIDWLDGEFALNLISFSDTGIEGSLLLQTSKPKVGNKTLNQLTDMATSTQRVTAVKTKVKGVDVTQVDSFGRNLFSYGWLKRNNLLLTTGTDFEQIANVKKKNSLLNSEKFKLTTESLPKENYGYFYLDLERVIATTKTIDPSIYNSVPLEIQAFTQSLKAIAFTTSLPDQKTAQLDVNLSLNKYNE